MTQRQEVENYLREGKSLTSWEAFERFGATRLASIICDLRKEGVDIETEDVKVKTRYGATAVIARYKIAQAH